MKQRLIILAVLILLSTSILFALNLASDGPNKKNNGFKRLLLPNAEEVLKSDEFKVAMTDICGFSGDSIFISSRKPGKVYMLSGKLNKLDSFTLPLKFIPKFAPVFYTTVQFPYIYILAGNARKLVSGNLTTKEYTMKDLPVGPFGNGRSINSDCHFFRELDTATVSSVFVKVNGAGQVIARDTNLSERLGDAGFIHDGQLSIEPRTGKIFYVDFYSNHVTCFDTNLKLLFKAKTLDTTSQSMITVGRADKKFKSSRPMVVINRFGSTAKGLLLVVSNLKADNEISGKFRKMTVVDRFSTSTGVYAGSFYLPLRNDRKLKAFKMYRNRCYALYDHQLYQFRIP